MQIVQLLSPEFFRLNAYRMSTGLPESTFPINARVLFNWTAPCCGGGSGFMVRSAVALFRVFRVIRGEKHNRIFTTDFTEYTDESQGPKKAC